MKCDDCKEEDAMVWGTGKNNLCSRCYRERSEDFLVAILWLLVASAVLAIIGAEAAKGEVVSAQVPITEDTIVEGRTFEFLDDGQGWRPKGFVVKAGHPIKIVRFENCRFIGDGSLNCNQGPVVTSESGCQIERFEILNCHFEGLTYGANLNCSRGGSIKWGLAYGNTFTDIQGSDPQRGKGLALAMGGNGHATSSGNRFIRCGRHGLYVSNGGPVESIGDCFEGNGVENATNFPLAALAIGRGSHVRVQGATFRSNRDSISLTNDNPARETKDVTIEFCGFYGSGRYDIYLNGDNPGRNGLFEDVTLRGNHHESESPTWCAIAAHSFGATVIDDTVIRDPRPATGWPAVWFTGRGPSHGLRVVECVIESRRPPNRAVWLRGELGEMDVRGLRQVRP